MKVKKQKRHRKAVRFYTACFGFRDPFKILCDGTFVHHLLDNEITPADTALANILGASVKLFTTRCCLAEIKSLGKGYTETLNAASNLITARCDHEKRKSGVACLTEVIGEKNLEHFFVASQDAELREKFQKKPGVPVIYGLRNALFLERPSSFQHQFVKAAEEERSNLESKMLLKAPEIRLSSDGAQLGADENKEDNLLEIGKDKAQFKRKRAKGPNPLSCKKKRSKDGVPSAPTKDSKNGESSTGNTNIESTTNGESSSRCRARKRKRSRKGNTTVATV